MVHSCAVEWHRLCILTRAVLWFAFFPLKYHRLLLFEGLLSSRAEYPPNGMGQTLKGNLRWFGAGVQGKPCFTGISTKKLCSQLSKAIILHLIMYGTVRLTRLLALNTRAELVFAHVFFFLRAWEEMSFDSVLISQHFRARLSWHAGLDGKGCMVGRS